MRCLCCTPPPRAMLCYVPQIEILNSVLYHLPLWKEWNGNKKPISLLFVSIQSTFLFDDDKTMEIIYSFWRQNRFITFNKCKCYMPSHHHHHHHRHPAVLVLVWLLTQSPRPNGWLAGWLTVLKAIHCVWESEQPEERIKCSVKFTSPSTTLDVLECVRTMCIPILPTSVC